MSDNIAVIGSGKIGELVIALLAPGYSVSVYDKDPDRAKAAAKGAVNTGALDVNDEEAVLKAIEGNTLVINCCPHFCNLPLAKAARKADVSYIDMSEDVETGNEINKLADGASGYFVPRCGIAPGFIQIVAGDIIKGFDEVEKAHLRVGALPENPTNALKYNLTWSTDGLINECGNPCEAIVDGELRTIQPLEGYERIIIEGVEYEAFNTSGGLGTLARSMAGKVKNLNYKTLRYLGHRDLMKFLLFDLKLNEYRKILRSILESAVPATQQDQVVVFVSVVGNKDGQLIQKTYSKTVRHGELCGRHWTAIQISTASAAASVAELVMKEKLPRKGYVCQEEIDFQEFCSTPHGGLYRE
ncbi:saccharopine dehydrogenase C-terminal domain-containing protein [Elusimicrobiota bacterium]